MLCSNWDGFRYRQQHPEMAARLAAQGMAAGLPVMVPAGYAYGNHPHINMHMPQVPQGFAHYHHQQSVPGNAFYPHTVSRGFN